MSNNNSLPTKYLQHQTVHYAILNINMSSSLVLLQLSFFHLAKQDQNMAFTKTCNRWLQHPADTSVLNGLVDPCAYYVIYCQSLKQRTCSICSLSYNKNTVKLYYNVMIRTGYFVLYRSVVLTKQYNIVFNLLATDFFFRILAHSVFKM